MTGNTDFDATENLRSQYVDIPPEARDRLL